MENSDRYNIFLIGNNPQEISTMESNLSKYHRMDFIADVGFDLRDSLSKVFKQKPNYILLDDCYPLIQVRRFIQRIRNNRQTEEIPIALLKSSNRHVRIDGIQDFFLKDNFSADRLFHGIKNSRKIRRTQIVLYRLNKKRRRQYQNLKYSIKNLFSG